ncbi:MAG: HAMP domain-containing protein [Ruminococcus sp.]|nr:HAMP domain-containing protein [Ruminococcus sp.]
MKLSWKFFFLAYIMVLLSAGVGGYLLVRNTTDTLWQERVDRCKSSHTYAVNSFYSMSDAVVLGTAEAGSLQSDIEYQIQRTLDSSVSELEIIPLYASNEYKYADLKEGYCFLRFNDEGESSIMEISTKVSVDGESYMIRCESDFTALKMYNSNIWMQYRITIVSVAVLCGILLFVLANRLTKPLGQIAGAVSKVSEGNYGYSIDIKGGGAEVQTLADNFNRMSTVVAQSLEKVEDECKRRDTFVADFTHEIKTPVTSIIGYADMLSRFELSEEEKVQAASAVYREGRRLERLSMQLLELIVTENEKPKLEPVALRHIESSIKDALKFSAEKYLVNFETDFADCSVVANEALLLSLIYNLADNAFKASYPGGKVRVTAGVEGAGVRFTVADEGHGIAKEHINRITEPFYREDKSRSRRSGGAGIGLALCKEICSLHGAVLEIESEKGKGTTVSFVLSVYKEEADYEE